MPDSVMTPEGGRLLVVDDDELNRDMLSRRLARRGHVVQVARDGAEALSLLESGKFDLVLLDIMMPGIDGLEVLRRIRRTRSASELPVIMATAKDSSDEVVTALELGANDYVTKPLDFPVVVARLATQLGLKRARQELATAHGRMKRDLDAAARLQRALIPRSPPGVPGARFAWQISPCDELAGDILDLYRIDERRAGLYLLDVSGHGVRAALLSVTLSRLLSWLSEGRFLLEEDAAPRRLPPMAPAEVAQRLNARFPMDLETMQYFTFLHGILDLEAGAFRFVSAAHPGPVHLPAGGAPQVHPPTGMAIGWFPSATWVESTIPVKAGDRVYLCSDGLIEAAGTGDEPFGNDRLLRAIEASRGQELSRSVSGLLETIRRWCGESGPGDDLSVLAFEIGPDPR